MQSYADAQPRARQISDSSPPADPPPNDPGVNADFDEDPRERIRRECAGFASRADYLATWALERLVNRVDVWGGYGPNGPVTKPVDKTRRGTLLLELADLRNSFSFYQRDYAVGVHAISQENTSKFVAIDVDCHDGDDPATAPARNHQYMLLLRSKLLELGFDPLVIDSNGRGGFHIFVVFATPIPSDVAYRFGKWLVADAAEHGFTKAVESFPKQAAVTEEHPYGNWIRISPFHHKRPHVSRVLKDGTWLSGADTDDEMRRHVGDDPALIPEEVRSPPPPQPIADRAPVVFDGSDLATGIFMAMIEALNEEFADQDYSEWRDGIFAIRGACTAVNIDIETGIALADQVSRKSKSKYNGETLSWIRNDFTSGTPAEPTLKPLAQQAHRCDRHWFEKHVEKFPCNAVETTDRSLPPIINPVSQTDVEITFKRLMGWRLPCDDWSDEQWADAQRRWDENAAEFEEADQARMAARKVESEFAKAIDTGARLPPAERWESKILTFSEMMDANFGREYLIPNVMVRNEFLVVGAQTKTLKTSIGGEDLSFSLASGTPWLGRFGVARKVRVLFCTGESGEATTQVHFAQFCRDRGIDKSAVEMHVVCRVPKIANAAYLERIRRIIFARGIEVIIIDPCFLALELGENSNLLYVAGAALVEFLEMCQELHVTPVLIHHFGKSHANNFGMPEMGWLSGSGVGEAMRQWILLNRREPFNSFGARREHKLWMSVGGSAGHSSAWGVDVDEGEFGGSRIWQVNVRPAGEVRAHSAADKRETTRGNQKTRVINALVTSPEGLTKTHVREQTGLKSNDANAILAELLEENRIRLDGNRYRHIDAQCQQVREQGHGQ